MAVKIMDGGESELLSTMLADRTLTMRLYQNDYTPVDAATHANFTEADFTGYLAVDLAFGAVSNTGGTATAVATAASFVVGATPSRTNTIYGWYIEDQDGAAIAAERFSDAPRAMDTAGDTIDITPTLELFS